MKTLISTFFVLAFCLTFAQSPNQMSYQAVVRNASNALVTNQPIGMKVSILQGTATGTVVFAETYSPAPISNANGLVTLSIGSGTPVTGSFTSVKWENGPYFIKTEADPTGGTSYTITGTSQLLSVPFAQFSNSLQATSDGGMGVRGKTTSSLWLGLYENDFYRGYIGSYSGANNEDVDFGTGGGNSAGNLHLTIEAQPKVTLNKNGKLGIGTQSPEYPLQVNGITGTFSDSGIRIHNATANTGWSFYPSATGDMIIGKSANLGYFNGTTGAYTTASDERLKTNFEKLSPALESVKKLNIWKYEYKHENPTHRKDIGVTAQDLQKYFPELVFTNTTNEGNPTEKDQMSVNYAGLSVVALKALQEQQVIIENLEKRIKVLESKK